MAGSVRRRILAAIVLVALAATTVLTVPLAIVTGRREQEQSRRELENIADRAASMLPSPLVHADVPIDVPAVEANIDVGVYLPDGTLVAGAGPGRPDPVTAGARFEPSDGYVGDMTVHAEPVVVDGQEVAVVRVAEPTAEAASSLRGALAILLAIDVAAVGAAAAIGWFVAARLAKPVGAIRDNAVRLGLGDFSIDPARSGVGELDDTADALAETARRVEGMLARERAFSANASHQLRTPLAALRLTVETEMFAPRDDHAVVLAEVVNELDRLEATVATLLDAARGRPSPGQPFEPRFGADLVRRWSGPLAARHRILRVTEPQTIALAVSQPAVDQIATVLIDNAVLHGEGTIEVNIAVTDDNLSLTVADEGTIRGDLGTLFERHDPAASGTGVGLHLARTLAEAEGGRLVLSNRRPTTFRLILPGRDAPPAPGDHRPAGSDDPSSPLRPPRHRRVGTAR